MNCPKCQNLVPEFARTCPICETDVGFPNVRAAKKTENIEALKKRLTEAQVYARAIKCDVLLDDFGKAIMLSNAVLCRHLSIVYRLMENDSELLQTYYQLRNSGQRLPEDNAWDSTRESVDAKLFPNYCPKIHFAFLALEDNILGNYGDCGLVLKKSAIEERATTFEENPILFCERHRIIMGRNNLPYGYRAAWEDRHVLAMAKLHPKFDSTKTKSDFSKILFCETTEDTNPNFIEVHIYGSIHRKSVERVLAKMPAKKADRGLFESLKELLEKNNIPLEVI